MSFELPTQRKAVAPTSRWSGAAFLIEAMLLLVFVMASLAVFTQMFAAATERANASRELTDAVAVASAAAERFSADPAATQPEQVVDGMRIVCQVTSEPHEQGTLYHAQIDVYDAEAAGSDEGALYSISTSKYESGV